jgi:hypothetical protein
MNLRGKGWTGLFSKLIFEKAYDKVNWHFLQQVLLMKGFLQKWCGWIEQIVTRGSVSIKVDDKLGHFF